MRWSWLREAIPYGAMVAVEILDVGLTTLSKRAMSVGMSHFTFVLYSNLLASFLLLPSAFFLHTRRKLPPLTFSLLGRFFLLALTGITVMQNCVFTGVSYSSPTLASALSNLIPAFTFLIAILFRLEKLDIRSSSSQAKLIGTLVSISGALIVTLYKGPPIKALSPSSNTYDDHYNLLSHQSPPSMLTTDNWVLGALFIGTACLCASIWTTFQAATVKSYPAEMTVVAFNCFFGTVQCAIVSLIAERDPNAWILRPDIQLISIVYSAVIGSTFTYNVLTWCMQKKGPVFVAMFKPLGIAIAALMGAIFLGDTLHLGSVIGAIAIAVGFYAVMWGQAKEEKDDDDRVGWPETSKTLLLHTNTEM